MSDPQSLGESLARLDDHSAPKRAGRRRKRRLSGCVPMLVFIAVAVVLIAAAGNYVVRPWFEDLFADPEDYPGPGEGEVMFVVESGQTIQSMGDELEDLNVVASSEAFVDAAEERDEETRGIQAGTYLLMEEMKASDVVEVLIDPGNLAQATVTIPEGLRAVDIIDRLAAGTDFPKKQLQRALADTEALGLPAYARGNPEGYLFPATYTIRPDDTAASLLRSMVERWEQAAGDLDFESAAAELGYRPHEVMTVAALVQAEGRGRDMSKIARVIYNRLENPGTAGQIGRLQIDATVDYALNRPLTVGLTQEERENTQSPYNTFLHAGLPPGPIGNPGEEAIRAALKPTAGDWYYYVTVNLRTGKTKFAESYAEFQQYQAELRDYCATQSRAC
ncbi:endolytic transglycosylase MltG [Nocardioides immobilis]|uniref:Endolytic murein transglycosylase n=1 Tax=Nocardioides immobilis TaxID=2049295 RepID=A0A417XV29_9ACTN|nr:endolytic transglycosylase MltG [Nocardioides immobilis]RHW24338.1 endolytic transglycosylase MltG [Nocardioides immobilis]